MIEVIEEEARKPDKLPADVFKLIDSCLSSLSQKAKRHGLSDKVIKQREPERLLANRGHRRACNDAPRQPAQWRQARRRECQEGDEEAGGRVYGSRGAGQG
jgi:hypothetical protein